MIYSKEVYKMTYYEKLNIDALFGHNIIVELHDGRIVEGILDLDRLNEDWEEDGEPEGIAIETKTCLEGIYLQDVKSIELVPALVGSR
jgi:hypothetical protein